VHKRIISAVTRVEFIGDVISQIIPGVRWLGIIILNVHDSTENKSNDTKNKFYGELKRVFS
jgi:hypothetical protein